ncbi:MAG: Regulatory protein RecX [Evtepia sp.]|jgi:regulatory protein|nr:Regulatory protein RecX [Evtepia sp.]
MRIENILPPNPPGKTWTLYLEDGKSLRVGEGEMMDFAIHTGMDLDAEQIKRLSDAAVFSGLRDRAVSILAHRLCSKGELQIRLKEHGATQKQAEELVEWTECIGLLNEKDYAKTIVRHYSGKGYGIFKVKDELYRRKLPKDLWDDALKELVSPQESIGRYLSKHLKSMDRKALKKASDALVRRGFSWPEISEGMERFQLMAEDDERYDP